MSSDGTDVENEYSKVRRPPAPPIRNNSNVIYDLICSENNNYDEVPPLEGEAGIRIILGTGTARCEFEWQD